MLAATESAVFQVQKNHGSKIVTARFEGKHIRALISGVDNDAMALGDGTIWRVSHDDIKKLFGKIDEPIESLLILEERAAEAPGWY